MSLVEDHDLVKTNLKDLLLKNNSAKSTDIKRSFGVFKTSLSTCDQLSFPPASLYFHVLLFCLGIQGYGV